MDGQQIVSLSIAIIVFFVFATFFGLFFTIQQQTVGVIQRFGRFVRLARAGLNLKIPFIESVAGRVSLQVQALKVAMETKTKDDVFVQLPVMVQYQVISDKVYDAFYRLANPELQIQAFVADVVRAEVPRLTLDEAFENKDHVAEAVKSQLASRMDDYGYTILSVQILDVEPDQHVKEAMNRINAAQRLRVAATSEAEAEKIKVVKAAEADAESKALQGKGIADQRAKIIEGLRVSVKDFQEAVEGTRAQDVMSLVMLTQYLDTLKEMGNNSKVIMLPHSPGGLADLQEQIRNAIISGNEVKS
jgi:regulator of protease activity HflC (stomatin/prohibitin superfamily)